MRSYSEMARCPYRKRHADKDWSHILSLATHSMILCIKIHIAFGSNFNPEAADSFFTTPNIVCHESYLMTNNLYSCYRSHESSELNPNTKSIPGLSNLPHKPQTKCLLNIPCHVSTDFT